MANTRKNNKKVKRSKKRGGASTSSKRGITGLKVTLYSNNKSKDIIIQSITDTEDNVYDIDSYFFTTPKWGGTSSALTAYSTPPSASPASAYAPYSTVASASSSRPTYFNGYQQLEVPDQGSSSYGAFMQDMGRSR